MIARAGDVVVLEQPCAMTLTRFDELRDALATVAEKTGVQFVFVPPGTRSPAPEGLAELVEEVSKLRAAVERATRGSAYTGPR